jgi:hypothetical protein
MDSDNAGGQEMAKIRVNYFSNGLGIGGSEKTEYLFARELNKDKFDVTVFTYADAALDRKYEFERFCNVILLDRQNPDWQIVSNCDILHSFRSGYREVPEPGEQLDVPHFVETNIFGFYDNNHAIDRHLFMSKWLMNYTSRQLGFKPNGFDFVNNPVELPYTDQKLDIANKWHQEGATIDGRSGRPDNGIYNAINVNAVRLLRMQGYDIRFLVLAPPSNMIKDLIDFQIPFDFVEPTVEPLVLSMFYNSIDILAHARADGETFGVNIAEAMIHSKPVVTHIATPSIPGMGVFQAQTELVDNGSTGYIVNNDPAEYAEALKGLIDNRDSRIMFGMNGHNKAVQQYEVGQCVKKLENIYHEICVG